MAAPPKLLLVDDDPSLRQSLAEQLAPEYTATQAGTGEAAIAAARQAHFDAILLDLGLPDLDGREVCRRLRENGVTAPIIMLTALATEDDAVTGLDAGANDYVTKPFRLGELLARLRAQLRSHESSENAVFMIGPYAFHLGDKVLVDGHTKRKIRLTEKEAGILRHLFRAGDESVSREELLDGGSIYWIIKGQIRVRQRVVGLEDRVKEDGKPACGLILDPKLVPTDLRAMRPMQGWRYLEAKDAPRDLRKGDRSEEHTSELQSH